MQNILTLETNKYTVKLENFEGPLDLLCHLIDKNKMNIYDINLGEITDQYIEYINQMEKMNLEITSEFLVMASTLLYLKSKNLLPNQVEEEEAKEGQGEGPAGELLPGRLELPGQADEHQHVQQHLEGLVIVDQQVVLEAEQVLLQDRVALRAACLQVEAV